MGILKMLKYDNQVLATNVKDALDILYNGQYKNVVLYSSQMKKLNQMLAEIYEEIRKRNGQIQDVEQQMLPTEPYIWDDIDGCLAVKCAEISMGVFHEVAGNLYIFSKPKYDCLSNPAARKPLSIEAMTSLAMLGSMMTK